MHARSKSMVLKTVLATDRIPYETIPRSADAGVEDASEYSERLPVRDVQANLIGNVAGSQQSLILMARAAGGTPIACLTAPSSR